MGHKNFQRSETRLSLRRPRFHLLKFVVIGNSAYINIIFLVSPIASTLNYLILILGERLIRLKKFNCLNNDKTIHKEKLATSNASLL